MLIAKQAGETHTLESPNARAKFTLPNDNWMEITEINGRLYIHSSSPIAVKFSSTDEVIVLLQE